MKTKTDIAALSSKIVHQLMDLGCADEGVEERAVEFVSSMISKAVEAERQRAKRGEAAVPPTVSFFMDGIAAAANWVDQSREAFERESGQIDPDTGTFEFGNNADAEYSSVLFDVAEGIRQLHPNAAPVSPPVGEIVAWSGTNRDMGITRNIDFRFLRFNVKPGTKLYAFEPAPATIQLCDPPAGVVMRPRFEKPEDCACSSVDYCESCLEKMMSKPVPAVKSDLLTRAEALAVETRALASRIQAGE